VRHVSRRYDGMCPIVVFARGLAMPVDGYVFFLIVRPPPGSPLFPYTTLFRSPGALAITLAAKDAFDFLGAPEGHLARRENRKRLDRKSTRLNSSHVEISYAVFCLKKKIVSITI